MSALPTLAEVLALSVVRRGAPEVLCGAESLGRPVRWAHVAEIADIGALLRGGELLLTTGVALPGDGPGLERYVADVVAAGAAGLAVELGRRYPDALPDELVAAARTYGLPLVVLHHETRFAEITEAVHTLVADAQLAELRASEELHRTFAELAVEGADATTVVREAARLAQRPVVLENLAHQVLAYDTCGRPPADVLADWETRSRRVHPSGRTAQDLASGWLVTQVGARGTDWGRLVVLPSDSYDREAGPTVRDAMLVERAAEALALNRLLDRDRESLERQTHRALLAAVLHHALPLEEIAIRAKALGVPLDRRYVVAVVLRPEVIADASVLDEEHALRELAEAAAAILREVRITALLAPVDDAGVGLLVSCASTAKADAAVETLAARLRAGTPRPGVVAVGSVVNDLRELRRSLREAVQVAEAATDEPGRAYHRLPDIRLRGLVHLLRDDARLQTYVERELGPVLAWDDAHGSDLLGILRTYLASGRNKSAAADAAHLSRPAFYERLARLERTLGVDLDDVESCLSLHVALVALDAVRPRGQGNRIAGIRPE